MKPAFTLLIIFIAALAFAPAGASAQTECPIVPNAIPSNPCEDPGGGEEPVYGNLDVTVTTNPAATAVSPGWDDENLTYTATIENQDGEHAATNVNVTSEITSGSATFVSSSASQGGCTGQACSLGTIPSGGTATVTMVMKPSAGTVSNKFFATAAEVNGDIQVKTNTIQSAAPVAKIDWSMPERARDTNGDGLIDVGAPPGGYTPSSWTVNLNACQSTGGRKSITSYKWEVEGLAAQVTSNCQHTVTVPREQVYATKLTLTMNDGSTTVANRDVKVVDRFIVMMGDSYGSGEGNPHTPIQYGNGVVLAMPTWEDTRCHRSMWAAAARAARVLETEDPHSSVTYLSKACSGATIAEGILGPYNGIEPAGAATKLPPQLQQVKSVVGNARIDDLLISIGGNDAGFAKILADCLLPGNCYDNTTLINEHNTAIQGLMTSHYPAMRAAIEHPTNGLNVDSTFITEYPDFTTDSNGSRCDAMGDDILWPLRIEQAESEWAATFVQSNIKNVLTSQVAAAKNEGLDWNYVGGVAQAWTQWGQYGHGYCVGSPTEPDSNRWLRTFTDSCDIQGPPAGWNQVFGVWFYYCHGDKTFGQFHPNEAGHWATAQRYLASLRPKPPALDPKPDPGPGDPGGEDPGGEDPGGEDPGGELPQLPNGDPTLPGNLPPNLPVLGGTPPQGTPSGKPGRCATLTGRKRARCIKRSCGRLQRRSRTARTRKAKLAYRVKYRSCVKAVTRKG